MSKAYLDMAHVSAIPDAYRQNTQSIMAATGINIGNFAFRHALPRLLAAFHSYQPMTYSAYLAAAETGPITRVLVSCANWLGPSEADETNNAFRTMVFEKAQGPIDCFGLGAQAPAGATRATLGPKTLRMAQVLAERNTALSVRDQLTQDTLEAHGITNTVITGCPSNFINPDPDLGAQITASARALADTDPGWNDLRTILSEASGGHPRSGAVIRAKLALMADHPVFYALQTPALLPFALGESGAVPEAYTANSPFDDLPPLKQALRRALIHFSSIEGWMDFARSCQLSFGMRIHGTMVPLQAGVPALLIAHDSRTAGLARHMGIPAMMPEDFLAAQSRGPAPLLHAIAGEMEGYDARRRDLARVMLEYVTGNGLEPHASLTGLADRP